MVFEPSYYRWLYLNKTFPGTLTGLSWYCHILLNKLGTSSFLRDQYGWTAFFHVLIKSRNLLKVWSLSIIWWMRRSFFPCSQEFENPNPKLQDLPLLFKCYVNDWHQRSHHKFLQGPRYSSILSRCNEVPVRQALTKGNTAMEEK